MQTRKPQFAGSWYPGGRSECQKVIESFLEAENIKQAEGNDPVGGVTPHAGWYFSGDIACNVIHQLSRGGADVVVIFGMHLHSGSPAFIMGEGAWETPFGDLEIEAEITSELIEKFPFTVETAARFVQDNTIELQLPFVHYFFKDAKIVTIGVPPTEQSLEVGRTIAGIAKKRSLNMKIIGSTDLTHYGANYGFSPKGAGRDAVDWVKNENDRKVIDAMVAMHTQAVIAEGKRNHNACCSGAAATAIETSKALGAARADCIAYTTSYDKNPGGSFVGYTGIVMSK